MTDQTISSEDIKHNLTRRAFVGATSTAAVLGAMAIAGFAGSESDSAAAGLSTSESSASASSASADVATSDAVPLIPNPDNLQFTQPVLGEVAFMADPIADSDITEKIECDVVVVGGGMAGVCAAASASENGLKTILIEKGEVLASRGEEIGAIGDRVHKAAGIELDGAEFVNDALATAHFRCDRAVYERWVERSGEAMDWAMDACGDACGNFYTFTDNTVFAGVTTWGTGIRIDNGIASFVTALGDYAAKVGVDIRFNTPAVQLIQESDGTISGVIAKGADGYIKIAAAKGIVLATGGYDHNWDYMCKAIRPRDLAMFQYLNPTITDTGDGHMMGVAVGAAEDDYPHILMYDPAGAKNNAAAFGAMLAHLRVNQEGRRFVNESVSFNFLANAIMYQTNAHDFVLLSGDILDAFDKSKGSAPWTAQQMYDGMKDVLVQADSIEELAQKCGIDATNLAETISRYNELCAAGEDSDFGKDPASLIPIDASPYYAFEEGGICLVSVNGLRTDRDSKVLDTQGQPISGLYAIGNTSGSMFFGSYPHNLTGISHGRCVTFGYLVGRRLAGLED